MNKLKNSKVLKILTRIILIIIILLIHCTITYIAITNTYEYGSGAETGNGLFRIFVLFCEIIAIVSNVFIVLAIVSYTIDKVIALWKWAWSSDKE